MILRKLPELEGLEHALKEGVPYFFEEASCAVKLETILPMDSDSEVWGFLGYCDTKLTHGYLDYKNGCGGITIEEA